MTTITTASKDEVARFTAIAENWWDTNGEFAPLHKLNPPRLEFIRDHLCQHFGGDPKTEKPLKGLNLVDIGCGGGLLCEPMARLGANVTGIDAGEENINVAKTHAEIIGLDINYRHVLPEDLNSEQTKTSSQYDVVLSMEVIEHVSDLNLFLESAAGLLKPGGAMALSTLNRTLKSLALAKVAAEYILRWVPAGTHDWQKFVRPSELADGLRPHGVEITDLQGIGYQLGADQWSLARDLDVNYLAFAVKSG
jgi:2-polyprenyl-6-hydroxyphenyl methylase/3-demethylubiquinone-9 3-methyltransferase